MAKLKSLDVTGNPSAKFLANRQTKREKLRDHVRNKKIDRLCDTYPNVPEDTREEWINEDLDDLDTRQLESERFCDELSSLSNMAIKITGWRWYHPDRRIGRIWKSIHEHNISDNTATILLFRNGDPVVYRLSVRAGQETGLLHQIIQSGYTLSGIKVSYSEVV